MRAGKLAPGRRNGSTGDSMNDRRALKFRWRIVMAAFYFLLIIEVALSAQGPDNTANPAPNFLLSLVFLLVFFAGIFGMWFCWRPSRYFFLCTILFVLLYAWLAPDGFTDVGVEAFVGFLTDAFVGALVALAFYSPFARLFQREREDAAQPERQRVSAEVANP